MSTATVQDLWAEAESGSTGAPPFHAPDTYTMEASSYYIPDNGTSLALTCKIVEGPATGQAIGLGFIVNTKSVESFKRTIMIGRMIGLTDEYLKAITDRLTASGGLDGNTSEFLEAFGDAIIGRVFKTQVAKDDYDKGDGIERNTLAKRAKFQVISAPALPLVAGAPAPVAAQPAAAAAPAPAAAAVAAPAPEAAAVAQPAAEAVDPVAQAEAALAAAQAAAAAATAAAPAPAAAPAAAVATGGIEAPDPGF